MSGALRWNAGDELRELRGEDTMASGEIGFLAYAD
jgi:hypothetical protein